MKIDWNVGDDRSYGRFSVKDAQTGLGPMTFTYVFDQAGDIFDVKELTIGGFDALPFTKNMDLGCPDIGAPHDSMPASFHKRFKANMEGFVTKAIEDFMVGFVATLREMVAEGTSNPWKVA